MSTTDPSFEYNKHSDSTPITGTRADHSDNQAIIDLIVEASDTTISISRLAKRLESQLRVSNSAFESSSQSSNVSRSNAPFDPSNLRRFNSAFGDLGGLLSRFKSGNTPQNLGLSEEQLDSATDRIRLAQNQISLGGYFDEVFLVNLKHEFGNRLSSFHHLAQHGIRPRLWAAVNGYAEPIKSEYEQYQRKELGNLHYAEFNELELERGSHFISSPGAWGYIRTYESIIRFASEEGLKRILILEDDVVLIDNFMNRLGRFMKEIGNNWKVLQLGASQYDWTGIDNQQAERQGFYRPEIIKTCGSFAMALDHSIYNELLGHLSHMDAPFDFIPLGKVYEKHSSECFVAFPNLVMPDVRESNIRCGRNQADHSKNMRWNVEEFKFPRVVPQVAVVTAAPHQIGLPLGKSDLEQNVKINWLYYADGKFRPLHSHEDLQRINVGVHSTVSTEDMREAVEEHLCGVDYDAILILENNIDYAEATLSNAIESLFVSNRIPEQRVHCFRAADNAHIRDSKQIDVTDEKVSIIITTYRRPDNLANAIESILAQTHSNIELIVVDDNGDHSEYREQTAALMSRHLHDSRVSYIKHATNAGGAAARNTGIMACTGEYISFLDDDDIYLPHKTEASLRILRDLDSTYGGVYGGFLGWNSQAEEPQRYRDGDLTKELLTLDYTKHYLCTNTALYRRNALIAINGYDESFRRHQDLELNLRFFEKYKMGVVPTILVQLRPVATDASNILDGVRLLRLKEKFLAKFKHLISLLPEEEQRLVYRNHYEEVERYFGGRKEFITYCRSAAANPETREIISIFDRCFEDFFDVLPRAINWLSDTTNSQNQFKAHVRRERRQELIESREPKSRPLEITAEQLRDLSARIENKQLTASAIRELPQMHCRLLDLRAGVLAEDFHRTQQLFSESISEFGVRLQFALRTIFDSEFDVKDLDGLDLQSRRLIHSVRDFIAGSPVDPSIDQSGRLPLGSLSDSLVSSRITIDIHRQAMLLPTGQKFSLAKLECIQLLNHGLLIHPNSDEKLVYVRIKNPANELGAITGLVFEHSRAKGTAVEVFLSPSLERLDRSHLTTVPGGTKTHFASVPDSLAKSFGESFWLGVRVAGGSKPRAARLMLSEIFIHNKKLAAFERFQGKHSPPGGGPLSDQLVTGPALNDPSK